MSSISLPILNPHSEHMFPVSHKTCLFCFLSPLVHFKMQYFYGMRRQIHEERREEWYKKQLNLAAPKCKALKNNHSQ